MSMFTDKAPYWVVYGKGPYKAVEFRTVIPNLDRDGGKLVESMKPFFSFCNDDGSH